MNHEDIVYVMIIIGSITLGYLFQFFFQTSNSRLFFSALFGFCIAILTCTHDILHSIILIIINYIIITTIHSKLVHYFSFIWCFSYLLFFRSCLFFGLPYPKPFANALQLLLTLKAVGLAFEINDSYTRKSKYDNLKNKISQTASNETKDVVEEINKLELELKFISINTKPSFLEIFSYSYCYIGILTGPYYKFSTYKDWIESKYCKKFNIMQAFVKRGKFFPLIVMGYLILSKYVSLKDATKDEFYENPFWYRCIYMIFIFNLFRFRFYIAWILAEYSCYTAVFGAYPSISKPKPGVGPSDLFQLKQYHKMKNSEDIYCFDAINCIDEFQVETAKTTKSVLHFWNRTVQYWFASNIYKRISFKPAGQPVVMALSAYWHGIHIGYYLSMLTTSPCILAETLMEKGFKNRYLNKKYHHLYDIGNWFFRARQFDYMSMGFILLTSDLTIKYWKSVYFIGHISCFFFIIIGYLLSKFPNKDKK